MLRGCLPLFIFLIAAALAAAPRPAAAADEIPKRIQRNWAMPDCHNYEEALVLSRFFFFRSTDEDMTLLPAALDSEQSDYWVLNIGPEKKPALLQEDGVLKLGTFAKGAGKAKNWDALTLDSHDEYTGCEKPPKLIPTVMVRMMRYLDRIKEQCTLSVTNECAGVLFKMADENNDRKLTKPEIKHAVAAAIIFAELADKQTVADKDSLALIAKSKVNGEMIATDLLKTYDVNKSGSLDYNEIVTNFKAPEFPIVRETLLKAGALIPAFKVIAMTLPE